MHSLATMMPYLTSRLNVATFCCINGVQALSTFIKNGHQTKLRLVYIHGKCWPIPMNKRIYWHFISFDVIFHAM